MARPGMDKHVKFRRLCRMLGEPRPHVRGYLELLWEVGYENGDPFIGDSESVESAAEYPGVPGTLCEALLNAGGAGQAGFIEEVLGRPGTYQIHDLFDHAPEYVKKRQARENQRKSNRIDRNGGQRRTTADNGGQRRTLSDNGAPPAPAPAPAPAPKDKDTTCVNSEADASARLPDEIVSEWNKIPRVAHVRKLDANRKRLLATRLRESDFRDGWREAMRRVAASDFCTGLGDRGWRAGLDWFLGPGCVTRILEGNYDNRAGPRRSAVTAETSGAVEFIRRRQDEVGRNLRGLPFADGTGDREGDAG